MLVPFKDDNPKSTENTGFQAGSDSTPMANLNNRNNSIPLSGICIFTNSKIVWKTKNILS